MTEYKDFDKFMGKVRLDIERETEIQATISILKRLMEATYIELGKHKALTVHGCDIFEVLRFLVIAMENLRKEEAQNDGIHTPLSTDKT